MKVIKRGDCVEVDIHGLRTEDAEYRLLHLLENLGPEVKELWVIHGWNHGQALRDLVRHTLSHPRIKNVLPTLNEGQTRLILRKK